MECLLYSSSGCHLCEDAVEVLRCVRQTLPTLSWREVEIADDADLMERYGIRIPVLALAHVASELGWPFGPQDVYDFINTHTNT